MLYRRQFLAALSVSGLAVLATKPVSANGDDGLYDAPPPPNSAFVRLIDVSGRGNLAVMVGGKSVTVPETAVSGYAIVPAGKIAVVVGENTGEVDAASGKFYTLAVSESAAPVMMEDAPIANPAKAGIYFYNFSSVGAATLFATKQNVAVIENIATGAAGFRDINAVTLDLEVRGAGEPGALKGVVLQRRTGLTIAVFDGGKISQVENAVLP